MNTFRAALLVLLILPVLEISLLVESGSLIGVVPTVLLVVGTGVWGAYLFQSQGLSTWTRLQSSLARGEIPTQELVEGALLLVGGALLITPGFITDLLGLVCMLPQTRRPLAAYLLEKGIFQKMEIGGLRRRDAGVIEGEFRREKTD